MIAPGPGEAVPKTGGPNRNEPPVPEEYAEGLGPHDSWLTSEDLVLTQNIRRMMYTTGQFRNLGDRVQIHTREGVVTLQDAVTRPEEKRNLESFARRVTGVIHVNNELQVAPPN